MSVTDAPAHSLPIPDAATSKDEILIKPVSGWLAADHTRKAVTWHLQKRPTVEYGLAVQPWTRSRAASCSRREKPAA